MRSQSAPSTSRPASKRELWTIGVYFLAVLVISDVLNVRPGIEVCTAMVLIPPLLITRQPVQFFKDWWFFLLGLIMWNLSGPLAAMSPLRTHPHLDLMLNLDQAMCFGRDPVVVVQNALAEKGHVRFLDIAMFVVYNVHLPEPYIIGYFLWRLDRLAYFQFACSALILLVLGFLTFIVFPAVPPWLAALQYHRVTSVYNGFGVVLRSHPRPLTGSPLFYLLKLGGDKIAAFPSEHAAFPLLDVLFIGRVAGKIATGALTAWVLLVLFAIIYLGEHWVTDALAGYVYVVTIFFLVLFVTKPGLGHGGR